MDKKKIIKISITTIAVLGLMLLGGSSYMYSHGLSGKYANTEVKDGQIKVACVGDSITYGHGIENWEKNNYPAQLQKLLGEDYHVANFGSSGACVNPEGDQPYTSRAVYQESLDYNADIIVVMLGTNDSKPYNWNGKEAFLEAFEKILESYMQKENPPKLYICTPATAFYVNGKSDGEAEFDIQPHIVEEIAQLIREFANVYEGEAGLIDVNLMTKEQPEWFEKDGIHPNSEGAKGIAEYIATYIAATTK